LQFWLQAVSPETFGYNLVLTFYAVTEFPENIQLLEKLSFFLLDVKERVDRWAIFMYSFPFHRGK
jgi:hypothetical protein